MVIYFYVIEDPITEEIPSQCGQNQFCEYPVTPSSYTYLAWQPTLTSLDWGADGGLLLCN
jgi:hypothetical protein